MQPPEPQRAMPLELRFTLPLPPAANNLYPCVSRGARRHQRVLSEAGKVWQLTAALGCLNPLAVQYGDVVRGWSAITMAVRIYFKRPRDVDGTKIVLDTIAAAFGFDDTRITDLYQSKRRDPKRPRCEVIMREAQIGR